ncbi:uncharacterized protein LOC111133912 [Crassostrea virginica]
MKLFGEVILLSLISSTQCLLTMAPIVSDDMESNMNFIYINQKSFSYNEAIEVCASMNASLLTMRSWNKYSLIQQLFFSSEDWNELPAVEAWIGLTNTIYGLNWVDCVPLAQTEFAIFKDSNGADYKSSDQCYRVKEGEGFRWKQKKCGDPLGAICEQRILGSSCEPQTLLSAEFLDSTANDVTTCTTNCKNEVDCFAMVHYKNGSSDTCIRMKKSEITPSEVTVKIKQCISGTVKSASDVITPDDNNEPIPSWACSTNLALRTTPAAVSSTSSISTVTESVTTSVPEILYTSCFNITVTETVQNNYTTYIPQPTTSFIHSVVMTTTTTMVPTTVVMTTVLAPPTTTVVLTTVLAPPTTTVVLTTVLAPSTVTVEVTPSVAACQDSTTFINITNTKYIKEAVENITKALYVDKKTMSSYVRSKTCAEDKRPSSATVGYVGIVFIVVPFGLMFILDLRTIYTHIRDSARQCKTRTKEKSNPSGSNRHERRDK